MKEFFCEDYKRTDGTTRKGCGAKIKVLKDEAGKISRCEAIQFPCRTREGAVVWAYVPHFLCCPSEQEYRAQFIRDQEAKDAEFQKNKGQGQGQDRGGYNGGNRGGQSQGGGYRGNGQNGATRYSR